MRLAGPLGREPAHVVADLGEDHAGAEIADARNGPQLGDGGAKGFDMGVDLQINSGDSFVESVNLLEVELQCTAP